MCARVFIIEWFILFGGLHLVMSLLTQMLFLSFGLWGIAILSSTQLNKFTFSPSVYKHFFFLHNLASIYYLFIYWDWVSLCCQAGVQWNNLGSLHLHLLGSSDSPASASPAAGTTGAHHHNQLIFYIFSKDVVSLCWPGWSRSLHLVIHAPQPPKRLGL